MYSMATSLLITLLCNISKNLDFKPDPNFKFDSSNLHCSLKNGLFSFTIVKMHLASNNEMKNCTQVSNWGGFHLSYSWFETSRHRFYFFRENRSLAKISFLQSALKWPLRKKVRKMKFEIFFGWFKFFHPNGLRYDWRYENALFGSTLQVSSNGLTIFHHLKSFLHKNWASCNFCLRCWKLNFFSKRKFDVQMQNKKKLLLWRESQ